MPEFTEYRLLLELPVVVDFLDRRNPLCFTNRLGELANIHVKLRFRSEHLSHQVDFEQTRIRRTLTRIVLFLGGVGLIWVMYVLGSGFAPTERAYGQLPRLTVPALSSESFAFVKNPVHFEGWSSEYLFIKYANQTVRVFEVPTTRGRFTMPDQHWWKPGHLCREFVPDFHSKEFRCRDTLAPEWVQNNFRWTLDGKTLYPHVEDMISVKGRFIGREFVVGG